MACSAEIKNIIRCGQLGDLIEFAYPIGFSHWAVYEEDGQVVHFAVADENELQRMFRVHILQKVFPSCGSILLGQTMIQREYITSVPVPKGTRIKLSNDCHHYPASSVTDMRRRLNGLLGEVLDYNLLSKNCEHFATFVRYGVAVCNQVPLHQDKVQRETTHLFQNIITQKSVSQTDASLLQVGDKLIFQGPVVPLTECSQERLQWALSNLSRDRHSLM